MSALTIYECPVCRQRNLHPWPAHHQPGPGGPGSKALYATICSGTLTPVRVFREQDVRPLWEALAGGGHPVASNQALRAFPAPEEWKR